MFYVGGANGQLNATVSGNTIENSVDSGVDYVNWILESAGISKDSTGILFEGNEKQKFTNIPTSLKPNTQYTLIFYVVETTMLGGSTADFSISSFNTFISSTIYLTDLITTTGQKKALFTTKEEIPEAHNRLRLSQSPLVGSGENVKIADIMIVEGDYTDISINYFSGTKSTLSASKYMRIAPTNFG